MALEFLGKALNRPLWLAFLPDCVGFAPLDKDIFKNQFLKLCHLGLKPYLIQHFLDYQEPETREPRETTGQKQNKAIKGS